MNSLELKTEPYAQKVVCNESEMNVYLVDGRIVSVPLVWFPRLIDAILEQLSNDEILGLGEGIHFTDIDEDISVRGLLAGNQSVEYGFKQKVA